MDSNRRITEKLLRYWIKTRDGHSFPEESAIDKTAISDIWENCFLVKITKSGNKYSYVGQNLLPAFGGDIGNKDTEVFLSSPFTAHLQEKFLELMETPSPLDDENTLPNSKKEMIKYRLVLLPLAGKNGKISSILGGMRWKKT